MLAALRRWTSDGAEGAIRGATAHGTRGQPVGVAILVALCLVLGGLISIHMKQDGSWDLQNYHLYNAWSLLEGRLGQDVWVTGVQTTFNPLLDVPYYVVSCWWLPHWPRLVCFLAGLPFGALIPMIWVANRMVFGPSALPRSWREAMRDRTLWCAAIATVIGLTGTTVVSLIGSTSGDLPTAVLVLAGLLAVLAAAEDPALWPQACGLAGAALGAAAGLKLTNGFYAPAMGLAMLLGAPAGGGVRGIAAFAVCWLALFLPPAVWWGAHIHHLFGNPVFPMASGLFPSPWDLPGQGRDTRFLPKSILQALFYPFFWFTGLTFTVTERPLFEPRWALAFLGIVAVAVQRVRRRCTLPPRLRLLLIFTVSAYGVWEAAFSIIRYAALLELLTGTWIMLGIAAVFGTPTAIASRRGAALCAVVLVFLFADEQPYDGGRLKRFGHEMYEIGAPHVPDGTVIVLAGRPMGFIAPFVQGRDLTFVNVTSLPLNSLLMGAVQERLRHAATVYALVNRDSANGVKALERSGWIVERDRCTAVENHFQARVAICPVHKSKAGE